MIRLSWSRKIIICYIKVIASCSWNVLFLAQVHKMSALVVKVKTRKGTLYAFWAYASGWAYMCVNTHARTAQTQPCPAKGLQKSPFKPVESVGLGKLSSRMQLKKKVLFQGRKKNFLHLREKKTTKESNQGNNQRDKKWKKSFFKTRSFHQPLRKVRKRKCRLFFPLSKFRV